ncbi:hypothetical protein HDG34_005942 [Paraburkholderia sp. HC6.4b]|uniref:hypothetical protein n=1 Tax=unclassified Paraburkholderia TaxID=2615204 RepID=UPI00161C4E50|nr:MULTISPECIES: hypothetical protein [unclassified Paraburkholderia]MBB5411976.1 hypothetical protein [Paraburkholderia sp. HC6.4b]MBB5454043.1 hypothetical protein [Paraburkholderia sp. Kb1A]
MPKPQGTYLRVQGREKVKHQSIRSKSIVSVAHASDLQNFYDAVCGLPEAEVTAWYREMASLVRDIEHNEVLSKDDKVRKRVSEVLGQVRRYLEQARDYKQLEGRLQLPVYPVMQAPLDLGAAGAQVELVIALCQICEAFVRIIKRRG